MIKGGAGGPLSDVVVGPRVALTFCASGLFALVLQGGCAQSVGSDFGRPPDGGSASASTGGQLGIGGLQATGGAGDSATGGTGGTAGAGGSGGAPAGAATFTQIYQTILTTMCAGSQCHSPGRQAGVSFASQSSAYSSVKSRVVAGDAEASSLYALLNAGVMPPVGNNLSSDQLAQLASWIDAGAAND